MYSIIIDILQYIIMYSIGQNRWYVFFLIKIMDEFTYLTGCLEMKKLHF